jgi:hypothetical protein
MSSSQTFIAGSGISSSLGGSFTGTAWTSPGNITASDNTYASVTLNGTSAISSECLVAQDFGFEINGMATILGIVVNVERKASANGYIRDNSVYLIKNGNYHGNNKSVGTYWTTTEGDAVYGSPTDLWGSSLLPEDIRSPTFGFMIQATYQNAYFTPATAYVDAIEMTIYYEQPKLYYGTTEVKRIFFGSAEVRKIAYGSTVLPSQ